MKFLNKDKLRAKYALRYYRIGHFLYMRGFKKMAYFFQCIGLRRTGNDIASAAKIDKSVHFPHPTGIVIGSGCRVGAGCVIYQNVTLGGKEYGKRLGYPVLCEKVEVYPGACVIGKIRIEKETVIGANCVINKKCRGVYACQPVRKIKGQREK